MSYQQNEALRQWLEKQTPEPVLEPLLLCADFWPREPQQAAALFLARAAIVGKSTHRFCRAPP
eukprot:SAG31_NODE_30586_length_379_cov_0.678571_1_plen_62_part_10